MSVEGMFYGTACMEGSQGGDRERNGAGKR